MSADATGARALHVLVVEDQRDVALALALNLQAEGYRVTTAADGDAGLRALLTPAAGDEVDLLVLDVMLPRRDGYSVLRALRETERERAHETPVLLLTAKGTQPDKVLAFKLGADDYVTKPFGVLELMARVNRMASRVRAASAARRRDAGAGGGASNDAVGAPASTEPSHRFGDGVEVWLDARRVARHGVEVALSPRAFDLLAALLARAGRVASRQDLLREVWRYAADVETRTLDSHVFELRRRLERDPTRPTVIRTVWKVGYRLDLHASSP
jgi:DNA-binding response OmpR family regulator